MIQECHRALTGMPPFVVVMEDYVLMMMKTSGCHNHMNESHAYVSETKQ